MRWQELPPPPQTKNVFPFFQINDSPNGGLCFIPPTLTEGSSLQIQNCQTECILRITRTESHHPAVKVGWQGKARHKISMHSHRVAHDPLCRSIRRHGTIRSMASIAVHGSCSSGPSCEIPWISCPFQVAVLEESCNLPWTGKRTGDSYNVPWRFFQK